jgi:hypothetical protein
MVELIFKLSIICTKTIDIDFRNATLCRYLRAVETGCPQSNPYHNAIHVAQVVHRLYTLLTTGGFVNICMDGSGVFMLSALLAAVWSYCCIHACRNMAFACLQLMHAIWATIARMGQAKRS